MSLQIASLNSGSNGNCYYIGNKQEAVFIDAGISCREIEKRMKRLGLQIGSVKAVFISHEHSDHINGIAVLAKKYQLPVYITDATLANSRLDLDNHLVQSFRAEEILPIGNISVTAFTKSHDAIDPFSFTITCMGTTVGVFTDIGHSCNRVTHYFSQCHAAFLESNYDERMLTNGNYPAHLKTRIRGNNGHLSNDQALDLFIKYKHPGMSHLFLSHLSKNNNCPDMVYNLFNANSEGVKIIVASRYEETSVHHIQGNSDPIIYAAISKKRSRPSQLSFSF